jgi:hypothetical protein
MGAACAFGIALYKFFKRKKGYSAGQIQEIEERARRRL